MKGLEIADVVKLISDNGYSRYIPKDKSVTKYSREYVLNVSIHNQDQHSREQLVQLPELNIASKYLNPLKI
jgi:hypothetical protein